MSAQNWPAGTVCRATVRGVPEKFGMWECNGYFFTPLPARGVKLHKASLVTDVRPLVVIDPQAQPRMAEPEWGERVTAHTDENTERREFVRFSAQGNDYAEWADRDDSYDWAELLDPQPVGGAS